jgi:hypothetical protein
MASKRQIEANRKNASRSTGPRTASGKARSSRNAFHHGLSRPARADEPDLGNVGDGSLRELVETLCINPDLVAAKLELLRIRSTRARLLAALSHEVDLKAFHRLRGLLRYERAAFARQKRLLQNLR